MKVTLDMSEESLKLIRAVLVLFQDRTHSQQAIHAMREGATQLDAQLYPVTHAQLRSKEEV